MNSKDTTPNILGIPWQILFLYAIKIIWHSRNKKVFQNSSLPIDSANSLIVSKDAEFWSSLEAHGNVNPYPNPLVFLQLNLGKT